MLEKYLFHLGREPKLSFAELEAVFGGIGLRRHSGIAEMEMEWLENPQRMLDDLGGCIKVSRVIWEGAFSKETLITQLTQIILTQKPEGKLSFGLSIEPHDERLLNILLKKVKQNLKNAGRNARFVNKNGPLSSAIIVKSGLMKHGTDFNVIRVQNQVLISQTIAIQNVHDYAKRDYDKPVRLTREGMLPPKLAQMMINLSTQGVISSEISSKNAPSNPHQPILYDPFCGSGTILGEALIKGMNVIGSDIDAKSIEGAQKNLEWLAKEGFYNPEQKIQLFTKGAQMVKASDLPAVPDIIVSEVDLGPPQSKWLTETEIHQVYQKLTGLYRSAFQNLHALLKPGTPLVIAFPLYSTGKKPIPIPHLPQELETLGFKTQNAFVYRRPDQVVGREIVVLTVIPVPNVIPEKLSLDSDQKK